MGSEGKEGGAKGPGVEQEREKMLGRLFRSIRPGGYIYHEVLKLVPLIRRRVYLSRRKKRDVIDRFHMVYYDSHILGETWMNTYWLGVETRKCPFDLWVYQEMVHELRPDVIIECGTHIGGSALFLASVCDLVGRGRVVTIDNRVLEGRPSHQRITYLEGDTTSEQTFEKARSFIEDGDAVMVILDSAHSKEHVLEEIRRFSRLVTKGSYLIVEDTNLNGNPVYSEFGPGPMEAVEEFLKSNEDFVADRTREKHLLTFNPRGFLLRT